MEKKEEKVMKVVEKVEKKVDKEDKEEKEVKGEKKMKSGKVGKMRSRKLEVQKLKEVQEVKELKENIMKGRKMRSLIYHVSGNQVKEDKRETIAQLDGHDDPWSCEICSKVFSNKFTCQRHFRTVHQNESVIQAGEHSIFFSGLGGKTALHWREMCNLWQRFFKA